MCLLARQSHFRAGRGHGFHEIESVGRAGAGQRCHDIEFFFDIEPEQFAGAGHHLHDLLFLRCGDHWPREQGADAFANQCRRIGHGTHHALCAQPVHDAVAADARCHAQVQGFLCMGSHGQRGLAEGLRLDRPNDHGGLLQKSTGRGLRAHTVAGLQLVPGLGKGLHHLNLARCISLADQAADDGAGHVAAADKCNSLAHGYSCLRLSKHRLSDGVVPACRQFLDALWPHCRQKIFPGLPKTTQFVGVLVNAG